MILQVDDQDMSARWHDVPLLDFAVATRTIAMNLPNSRVEEFEFTESEATIKYSYEDGSCVGVKGVRVGSYLRSYELNDASGAT